jgi:hypothetical protein
MNIGFDRIQSVFRQCVADPSGQAGWAKLYRGFVESLTVYSGRRGLPSPLGRVLPARGPYPDGGPTRTGRCLAFRDGGAMMHSNPAAFE